MHPGIDFSADCQAAAAARLRITCEYLNHSTLAQASETAYC